MRLGFAIIAAALAATPAGAQIDTYNDIVDIRDKTPTCRSHPDAPIIGRVSGDTRDAFDRTVPVSFVGCFDTMRECERWRIEAGRTIGAIIIQNSCAARR